MSFQDEMNELGRKHQRHYVFDQKQVEACADELHRIIQAGLKAEVEAAHFVKMGLLPPKDGVMVEYPFEFFKSPSQQTPHILRADGSSGNRRTRIAVRESKEVNAVIKALKSQCSRDGINIYKVSRRDNNDDMIPIVRATFVLG